MLLILSLVNGNGIVHALEKITELSAISLKPNLIADAMASIQQTALVV
jgi:hypothetical protein